MPSGGTSDFAPEMLHAAARGEHYACFARPDTRIPFMAMPDALDAILTLMRAHHLGGIHMAQEAEKLSGNEDVDWLADSMVAAQQGEIQLIDDLLKQAQAG